MSKNYRTSCDDVQDLVNEKGITPIPTEDWQEGKTYLTLGLDVQCYPCLTRTTYLGVEGNKFLFKSEGVEFVTCDEVLYENTVANRLALYDACKRVRE